MTNLKDLKKEIDQLESDNSSIFFCGKSNHTPYTAILKKLNISPSFLCDVPGHENPVLKYAIMSVTGEMTDSPRDLSELTFEEVKELDRYIISKMKIPIKNKIIVF